MEWLSLAVFTSVGYGLYNFFIKAASDKINPLLATFYLTLTAAIVSGIALLVLRSLNLLPAVHSTRSGVALVIAAGVATGVADLLYFIMFARGQSLNVGLPFALGLATVLAITLSMIFLHETLTITKTLGIIITLVGIVILAKY
ncbi:MAG TPA: EamA family transporter [Candidatus Saccharimonadales bacterium]|nr:EamA family transporter [Candidatus Saccharimonadales bacterium]